MNPRHAARATKRSPWLPLCAAAIGAAALAIGANGVWATLNASATTTAPQSVSSGNLTLGLTGTGAGLTAAITNVAPGDTVNRHVVLTNGGSLATSGMTLAIASNPTSSSLLAENGKGLQVTVNACSVAWNPTAGTCSGTRTTALSARALGTLVATPAPLNNIATAIGGQSFLQISLVLPDQDEISTNGAGPAGTVQNQNLSVIYTFTATQRAATITNS